MQVNSEILHLTEGLRAASAASRQEAAERLAKLGERAPSSSSTSRGGD